MLPCQELSRSGPPSSRLPPVSAPDAPPFLLLLSLTPLTCRRLHSGHLWLMWPPPWPLLLLLLATYSCYSCSYSPCSLPPAPAGSPVSPPPAAGPADRALTLVQRLLPVTNCARPASRQQETALPATVPHNGGDSGGVPQILDMPPRKVHGVRDHLSKP